MSSVKLQDTKSVCKNLLHFYTLTTIREIKESIPFLIASKIINLNMEVKTCILKTVRH